MFCYYLSCFSRKNSKIDTSPPPTNLSKEEISCLKCKAGKNIITLDCKHTYCVKCYNKSKYFCKECERIKNRSSFSVYPNS